MELLRQLEAKANRLRSLISSPVFFVLLDTIPRRPVSLKLSGVKGFEPTKPPLIILLARGEVGTRKGGVIDVGTA